MYKHIFRITQFCVIPIAIGGSIICGIIRKNYELNHWQTTPYLMLFMLVWVSFSFFCGWKSNAI